jgi:parallel beta-helix repeat protein
MQSVAPLHDQTFLGEPGSVLSGAQIITRFKPAGRYWIATDLRVRRAGVGHCRDKRSDCLLSPALFRGDVPLRRVASPADLVPGSYALSAKDGRVVIADDPSGHRIEASTARYAFRSSAARVRIRGLVIERYDSPPQMGAIQGEEATGWQIEAVVVRYNAGAGVAVGTDGVVRDSDIHHNGQLGVTAGGRRILIEGNRIFANNAAGFDPAWEAGGLKITQSEKITMRGNEVRANDGAGLWCDIDCRDVVIEDNTVTQNQGPGIFYEISFDATIRKNRLDQNGIGLMSWYWGADILIAASQNVEVANNDILVRPSGQAVMLIDQGRERLSGTGGFYRTAENHVRCNRVTFLGEGAVGAASDVDPGSPNHGLIEAGSNRFDRNLYQARVDLPPTFVWGHDELDLVSFRAKGQERNGRVQDESSEIALPGCTGG